MCIIKNSCVCVLVCCVEKDIDVVVELLKVVEVFCIYIFIVILLMYIVIKLCSMLDEVIECVIYMVKWVCNYIDDVEFFCEDVGCMLIVDLVCVVEVVINVGVIIINILDIVGYIMLFEYVNIISGLYDCVLNIDKVIIFVYIYDDLGIVVGNVFVVVYVGVCQVEGVMNGIGECVGNCVLEEVIMVIKVCKDIMNVYININYYEIWCIS